MSLRQLPILCALARACSSADQDTDPSLGYATTGPCDPEALPEVRPDPCPGLPPYLCCDDVVESPVECVVPDTNGGGFFTCVDSRAYDDGKWVCCERCKVHWDTETDPAEFPCAEPLPDVGCCNQPVADPVACVNADGECADARRFLLSGKERWLCCDQ